MKFNLIFRSSVSACFEFDNNTAFYNDTPYRICVNGLWSDVEKRENVFSLFSLAPDTEYTVSTSLSAHTVTFKTLTETCAYTVKSFGATGDGVTNDTVNVQNAIDMCPDGGRVVFEKGVYLLGPIKIKSNITVDIQKGAVLLGSTNEADYPIVPGEFNDLAEKPLHFASWEGTPTACHQPFVGIYSAKNVKIVGEGIIDGNAQNAKWWINHRARKIGRPRLFFTHFAKDIYLHGVTGKNSASWSFHPYFSENVNFFDTRVIAPADSPNTDGLDPESCNGVTIIGMVFSVGDDAIAIKSGKYYMGMKYNTPAINHTIRNCKMEFAHGGVVLGSEMSGGVKNLTVEKCLFVGTDRGLRIKTRRGRGKNAVIDGLLFKNIKMDGVKAPFTINMFYFCDPDGKTPYVWSKEPLEIDERTPYIGSFVFEDIECLNSCWCAGYFYGLPERHVKSVTFRNVNVTYNKGAEQGLPLMMTDAESCKNAGFIFRNVDSVTIDNVKLDGVNGQEFVFENVKEKVGF